MSQSYRKHEITTTFKQEICRNPTFFIEITTDYLNPGFTALPLRYQVFPRFVNFGFAMFLYPLVFEIYIH